MSFTTFWLTSFLLSFSGFIAATKLVDKGNITIGGLCGILLLSSVPFANAGLGVASWLYTAWHTGFWNKRLF